MEYIWKLQNHEMRGPPMVVRHRQIQKAGKRFAEIFGLPITRFYKDPRLGFDLVEFDEWLMQEDASYEAANSGELGPDANCSMVDQITAKYGQEASDLIEAIL